MSEERRGELAEGCAVDGPSIPPALPRELVRPVTRLSRRAPLRVQCDPCDQSVRERPPPEPPPRGAALDPRAKVFIPRAEREERERIAAAFLRRFALRSRSRSCESPSAPCLSSKSRCEAASSTLLIGLIAGLGFALAFASVVSTEPAARQKSACVPR